MRQSRILHKIRNTDEVAIATCLHLTDPSLFELASMIGFDGIWMDLEHHGYSVETAGQMMRAARVGNADIVARPAKGEFMRMARLLEMGATGIMYPRCSDAAEAKEVVRWGKFAPLGQRGFDGSSADASYCTVPMRDYVKYANEQTFLLIQMEEPSAIAQAEAIAATPGVDMLMLGPADFSVLTGIPGQLDHPTVLEAIKKVSDAARNTGKHWAATCGSMELAKELIRMGCRLIFHGADIVMVKNGLELIRSRVAEHLNVRLSPGPINSVPTKSYLER
jgi:4-hydroxy-2-oxoheptanedioate aldolase